MRNCLGRSGGCRRDRRARLRCPWAAAGPGRASRRRADQRHKPHWCGGCRRDRRARLRYPRCRKVQRAWPRCRWAAGPGRTTSRRAEPPIIDPAPLVWRAPEGSAAVLVGGGGARTKQKSHIISYGHFWRPPRNVAIATTLLHDLKYPQGNYVRNCLGRSGGCRRDRRARLRCPWAAAGPGRASRRRADQRHKPHWCGGRRRDRRAWPRCPWAADPGRATRRRTKPPISDTSPTGMEGAGGTGGPGCGARGRRRGLARLRDRPLRAKLACGDLAGGPPHTSTHSGPARRTERAAARQGRRAFTQLDQTLNTVESANTQHNRKCKHSAQSRLRALSAVAQPPPRRPGPR